MCDGLKIRHATEMMGRVSETLDMEMYRRIDSKKRIVKYVFLDLNNSKSFRVMVDLNTYEPIDNVYIKVRDAILDNYVFSNNVTDIDVASLYPESIMEKHYFVPPRHYGLSAAMTFIDELHEIEAYRKQKEKKVPQIERVIFNAPATIVFWKDGTKTVVKAQGDDEFDPEKGLAMAICKKALGNDRDYYEVFLKHVGRYEKQQRKALEQYGLSSTEELASELQKAAEVATKVMGGLFGNRKDS